MLRTFAMLIFLATASVLVNLVSHLVPDILAILARPMQEACVDLAPLSPHRELISALICGQRLSPSDLKSAFSKTALLHLIVASGSHLTLLEFLVRYGFRKWHRVEAMTAITLVAYTGLTGFSPPLIRALLAWALKSFSHRLQLRWTALQILTLSGFWTLLLCNHQEMLLSLALSWIAGLAIHIASLGNQRAKPEFDLFRTLSFHFLIYVLMLPAFLSIAAPHPISIFWNLLLGPLLTLVLVPLAALSFFIEPFASALIDIIFNGLLYLVYEASDATPAAFSKISIQTLWIWVYLFTLVISAHLSEARAHAVRVSAATEGH